MVTGLGRGLGLATSEPFFVFFQPLFYKKRVVNVVSFVVLSSRIRPVLLLFQNR